MANLPSSGERRLHLRPTSRLGRVSLALILACVTASLVIALLVAAAGLRGRPLGIVSLLAGFSTGVAAFVTGVIAMVTEHERSVGVLFAVSVGTLFFLYVLGEFAFGH